MKHGYLTILFTSAISCRLSELLTIMIASWRYRDEIEPSKRNQNNNFSKNICQNVSKRMEWPLVHLQGSLG